MPATDVITAAAFSRGGAPLGVDLSDARQRKWQAQAHDTGTGSLTLQASDIAHVQITYRDLIQLSLNGTPQFAFVVENKADRVVDSGEKVTQVVDISGRGVLALLEEGVVYPWAGPGALPFTDARLFSFASPEFDDSSWGTAVTIKDVADSAAPYSGAPQDFPTPFAQWIWGIGGAAPYPVGDCYFRHTFTLADEATVRFFASADDGIDLYIDGALLISAEQAYLWGQTQQQDVFLPAGTHTLAVRGTNIARPSTPSTNIAAIVVAAFEIGADGSLGAAVTSSSSAWKCMPYPTTPPGLTPGRILGILLGEANARGVLTPTFDFTDTLDSAGNAWLPFGEFAFPVGNDLLTAVKALQSAGVDVWMDAFGQLHAYNVQGSNKATVLAPAKNLSSLEIQGTA